MGDQMTKGAGAGISAAPTWTVIVFVAIALLAVLTIAGIIWGARMKRRQTKAEHELQERADETDCAQQQSDTPISSPSQAPQPPSPSPPLTTPARVPPPPPSSRSPVVATPEDQPHELVSQDPIADTSIAATTPTEDHNAAISVVRGAPSHADTGSTASPADDHVTQLKGLGPKVAGRLAEQSITTIGQIAALNADEAQALDAQLGPFAGRMERDRWIEQARFLAAGDKQGFEAVFGKL